MFAKRSIYRSLVWILVVFLRRKNKHSWNSKTICFFREESTTNTTFIFVTWNQIWNRAFVMQIIGFWAIKLRICTSTLVKLSLFFVIIHICCFKPQPQMTNLNEFPLLWYHKRCEVMSKDMLIIRKRSFSLENGKKVNFFCQLFSTKLFLKCLKMLK